MKEKSRIPRNLTLEGKDKVNIPASEMSNEQLVGILTSPFIGYNLIKEAAKELESRGGFNIKKNELDTSLRDFGLYLIPSWFGVKNPEDYFNEKLEK